MQGMQNAKLTSETWVQSMQAVLSL